jgi:alkyldihydroxyacetonephosphate synthase
MLINFKVVTPSGTIDTHGNAPRQSVGPDVLQMIIGSEGMLGIVTEAVFRVCTLPEVQEYGSIVFPTFEDGVAALNDIAAQSCFPCSLRLVDNLQFQFGQVMKCEPKSQMKETLKGHLKKYYLTKVKKLDMEKICAATLVFEGTRDRVELEKRIVFKTIKKYGGFSAGASNGIRGYFLTFMIAYIRDFALNYHMFCESFETSCPWANVLALCHDTKEVITQVCKTKGVRFKPWASCRVTQSYDTGACLYFYFAFVSRGLENPIEVLEAIETGARDEMMRHGGSLSHHHGIGKLRAKWMEKTVGGPGMKMLRGIKQQIDPKNTMCASNMKLADDGGFEYYT